MRNIFLLLVILIASVRSATFNITEPQGLITSVSYPTPYGNNLNDTWTITVQEGYRAVLYFTAFELEDSFDDNIVCSQDYVEISFGRTDHRPLRFCGNARMYRDDAPQLFSQKFNSITNQLFLRMVTDYSNEHYDDNLEPLVGFKAQYISEDRDECAEQKAARSVDSQSVAICEHFCNNYQGGYKCSCRYGYKLHDNGHSCIGDCAHVNIQNEPNGTVHTPGYPDYYPGLTDCTWTITTDSGKRVQIQFEDIFEIEDHPTAICPFDYLKVFDSSGQIGSTFCGTLIPFNGTVFESQTNWIRVSFHSDLSVEKAGFQLSYTAISVQCQVPQPPDNGGIRYIIKDGEELSNTLTHVPFSALIKFDCNEGFRLIGSGKVACLKDGSLSDVTPKCVTY